MGKHFRNDLECLIRDLVELRNLGKIWRLVKNQVGFDEILKIYGWKVIISVSNCYDEDNDFIWH